MRGGLLQGVYASHVPCSWLFHGTSFGEEPGTGSCFYSQTLQAAAGVTLREKCPSHPGGGKKACVQRIFLEM